MRIATATRFQPLSLPLHDANHWNQAEADAHQPIAYCMGLAAESVNSLMLGEVR